MGSSIQIFLKYVIDRAWYKVVLLSSKGQGFDKIIIFFKI